MLPLDPPPSAAARSLPAPPRASARGAVPSPRPAAPGVVSVLARREGPSGVVALKASERALTPEYQAIIGGRSLEVSADVDCRARTIFVHTLSVYAGDALQGRVTERLAETGWRAVLPGTTSGRLLEAGCKGGGPPATVPQPHGLADRPAPIAMMALSPPAVPPAPHRAAPPPPTGRRGTGPTIQVASADSEAGVRKLAARFTGRYGALARLTPEVAEAQVSGRTVYRLIFSGAADRAAASAACAEVRAGGDGCLVRSGARP